MINYKNLKYAAAQYSFLESLDYFSRYYNYKKNTYKEKHALCSSDEIIDILIRYRDELTGIEEKKLVRDYLTSVIRNSACLKLQGRIPVLAMELWHAEIIELATVISGKCPEVG